MNMTETDASFFAEYTSRDAILKYTRATAGQGISYLLDHEYFDVYRRCLAMLPESAARRGLRLLEFGCGGGMNVVHLAASLPRLGMQLDRAIGTDFSPVLIDAANREATTYLDRALRDRLEFHVARNESVIDDLARSMGTEKTGLHGSIDFAFGVNTIRYCHRFNKQVDCAAQLFQLLKPGGVCLVIDMNDRFLFFRSAWKDRLKGNTAPAEECYLPSLEEYTAPFRDVGFDVRESRHFCWVPHSAGRVMRTALVAATPVLDVVAGSRAMRSLVIARRPE